MRQVICVCRIDLAYDETVGLICSKMGAEDIVVLVPDSCDAASYRDEVYLRVGVVYPVY